LYIATVPNGDNVALIPVKINDEWIIKLLNLDEWARKFAERKYSNVVFLCSCCRSNIADYKSFSKALTPEDIEAYKIKIDVDAAKVIIN